MSLPGFRECVPGSMDNVIFVIEKFDGSKLGEMTVETPFEYIGQLLEQVYFHVVMKLPPEQRPKRSQKTTEAFEVTAWDGEKRILTVRLKPLATPISSGLQQ